MTHTAPPHLGAPYAEITQVGRWTYAIRLHFDLVMTEPAWHRLGLKRAERKARKELARHLQREGRSAEPRRIYTTEEQP
jgi:hypothetical protein